MFKVESSAFMILVGCYLISTVFFGQFLENYFKIGIIFFIIVVLITYFAFHMSIDFNLDNSKRI